MLLFTHVLLSAEGNGKFIVFVHFITATSRISEPVDNLLLPPRKVKTTRLTRQQAITTGVSNVAIPIAGNCIIQQRNLMFHDNALNFLLHVENRQEVKNDGFILV